MSGDELVTPEAEQLTVLLFAAVREAAGTGRVTAPASGTVAELIGRLAERHGEQFLRIAEQCSVVVDGDRATRDTQLDGAREVALLPPVAGG